MSAGDHVVVNTTTGCFECRHCGASYKPSLPCSFSMYVGMSRLFIHEHRRCPAPAADPMPAPTDPADPALPIFLRQQAD